MRQTAGNNWPTAAGVPPRFGAQSATLKVFIQQIIVEGVIAEQPAVTRPALADTHIAHQSVILLGEPQLTP